MTAVLITFMIVATVFALATIGYVVFDIVREKQKGEGNKKK